MYVNGVEVIRSDMNQGTAGYTTLSYDNVTGNDEALHYQQIIPSGFFVTGNNTIAVEIHQSNVTSADISFDMAVTAMDAVPAVHRGPYLQDASPTSIRVLWKTDTPTNARVKYGSAVGTLTSMVDVSTVSLDHQVTVTGLQPSTVYFYSIGTSTVDLAGNSATYFFKTSPLQGGNAPVRVWVIGDAGVASLDQQHVRDAYLNYVGANKADAWLMLRLMERWRWADAIVMLRSALLVGIKFHAYSRTPQ